MIGSLLSGLAAQLPFSETACSCLLPAGTDIWKCIVFLLIRHLSILCVNYFIFIFCGKGEASQWLHHSPRRQGLENQTLLECKCAQGEKQKGQSGSLPSSSCYAFLMLPVKAKDHCSERPQPPKPQSLQDRGAPKAEILGTLCVTKRTGRCKINPKSPPLVFSNSEVNGSLPITTAVKQDSKIFIHNF